MNLDLLNLLEAKLESYRASSPLSPTFLDTLLALATLLKTYHPARTISFALDAITLAQTMGEMDKEARAWSLRAYAEAQLEMDDDAHHHAQIALSLSGPSKDPITRGYAYLGMGQYLINQFRYDEALAVGLNGYDLLESAGDIAAQANIAFIIMGSYSRLGNRQQAEFYALRAIEQYREIGLPGGEIVQLNNLAMHFLWMEEYETAWQVGEQALTILRKLTSTNTAFDFSYAIGAVMHTLAEITLARQDLEAAAGFLREGLAFVRGTAAQISPNDETFLLLALGKLHCARQEFPEARRALLTALRRARHTHHRWLKAEIAQALMQLYEGAGNYRRTLWYCRFHQMIDKARYQDQLVSKMQQLEVEHEVRLARREMDLLTEKNTQLERAYTDLRTAHILIRELSIRDGLTKLHNRQYFEEWSRNAFDQSQREDQPFTLFLSDVDNFKQINDTFLHHTGDIVLRTVASELASLCPTQGCAARYGGEEFVLGVLYYDYSRLYDLAETFRQRIQHYPWYTIHPNMQVTISIGVASHLDIKSLNEQLIQADRYLYMAKQQGKNRVVSAATMP